MSENKIICDYCDNEVKEDYDFCPFCGELFVEGEKCKNHNNVDAKGVCIICGEAYCDECGGKVTRKFLCNDHAEYEIFQNMVRVYGTNYAVNADYIKSCLDEAGLHPMVYTRKTSPISLGGLDYSMFRSSGDYKGHLINELKIMVPLNEVPIAEQLLPDFINQSE